MDDDPFTRKIHQLDLIDLKQRFKDDNIQLHVVKSIDSWESREFEFGGEGTFGGPKSIPFSQPFNPDMDTNRNFVDDGLETIKFSIL
jgi:hypothetical protein